MDAAAAAVEERFGVADLVVSNVGVQLFGAVEAFTDDEWRWLLDVNVTGSARVARAFLPLLRQAERPRLAFTTSSSILDPASRLGAYQASKFAVWGLAETLRLELADDGIGVSVIFPSGMITRHLETSEAAQPDHLRRPIADDGDFDAMIASNPEMASMLATAEDAAAGVIEAVLAGEPYVITHGDLVDAVDGAIRAAHPRGRGGAGQLTNRATRGRIGALAISFPRCSAPRPEPGPRRPARTRAPPRSACARIRSRAGSSTCCSAATASETCSLIISQYCAGDCVTSSTSTSHSATSRSPASSYRAPTYPGAAHRNMFGPSGSGGATTASVAIACMAIDVHGFSSGLTHTDEQSRPPGLSTRANSAVASARSGKNMYPNRTETLSKVASSNGRSSALHTCVSTLAIPCARARRAATSSISAARSVSTTRPFGASLAMLRPGSPVPEAMSRCC